MKLTGHIVILIIGLAYWSCIDPIELDLDTGKTNLVVFGWVTNENVPYEIKLAQSNGYSDQSGYPPVNAAEVFVTDQRNIRYDFNEVGQTGVYRSDPASFVGVPGLSYRLTIRIDGKTYTSTSEHMPPLSMIEDAFINFVADPAEFEVDEDDENFFVSAFINDDPDIENYYRWKIYVNDEFRNQPEELVLFDDRFTNGNRFRFDAANVLFTESDQPYLQHMSLSAGAFKYYNDLKDQTSNSTLSPRTQPGIIIGNMSNVDDPNELVLGYFGASEVMQIDLDQ